MSDFVSFARAHGLILEDVRADDQWHRTKTEDKPRKRNGAYVFDGRRGVVINFATMANGAVWRDGARAGHIDRIALRTQRAISEAQKRARQTEARAKAEDMVKRAANTEHPYLVAKGFPKEKGLVLDGELLIPMREFSLYRKVNSVQRIQADGTKLFLPGGKAKGSVFFIGPMLARERWLCEGYATALSISAALHFIYREAQVIVCFSAGNLEHVGRVVKTLSVPSYVMADNDESKAGEYAAIATGLPWTMSPNVGEDANDYHQRHGLRALANLIRAVGSKEAVRERASVG